MSNPFAKLTPGQRLDGLPTAPWNSFLDVAAAHKADRELELPGGSATSAYGGGIVRVKNTSGSDRSTFDILTLEDILFSPTDNPQQFKNAPVLKGIDPGASPGKFVILQEPIRDGKIGRGMLLGITAVQVDVGHASDEFADLYPSNATKLRSGPFGAARIAYKPSGTGLKWCLVEIGLFTSFRVRCVLDEPIVQDHAGTASVYRRTGRTAYSDTGVNIDVLNDLDVDLDAGAVCHADSENDGTTVRWRINNADFACAPP